MAAVEEGPQGVDVRRWLDSLFAALERRNALYAALRVDDSLLQPGQELDLLVHPDSLRVLLAETRAVSHRFGLRIAHWVFLPRHSANIVLAWQGEDGWNHYVLDIRCSVRKKGTVVVDASRLKASSTVWDPNLRLRRLRSDLECALLLIRNSLDQRDANPRHHRILRRCVDNEIIRSARQLGWELTGSTQAGWVIRPVPGRSRSPKQLRIEAANAGRALIGRVRRKAFGINVIFYGPDGVGKTTQASMLADFFRGVRVRDVTVYHHLVQADQLLARTERSAHRTKTLVYRGARSTSTLSLITLLSYLKKLGFVLFRAKPALWRGHVLVHDRYLLDGLQKLQRVRGIRLARLEGVLPALTPREPFVIVLHAAPEVVADRTTELNPEGVADSYELLFRCLMSARGRLVWALIDANLPPGKVHDAVITHVLKVQSQRISAQS